MALLYLILWRIKGNRVNIIRSTLLFITIVILTGINSQGQVLLELPFYRLTVESLERGTYKGSLLIGSLYLSKIITSSPLLLPGSLGNFITRVFHYFGQFSTARSINIKNIIGELDGILLNLNHREENGIDHQKVKNSYLPLLLTGLLYSLDIAIKYKLLF